LQIEIVEPEIGDIAADGVDRRAAGLPFFTVRSAGWESFVNDDLVKGRGRIGRFRS
jgi:hypothetical protein